MAYSTFAAIEIGSTSVEMFVYQVSKDGVKQLDHVRHMFELGKSTYVNNQISFDDVEDVCDILCDFSRIMKEYSVEAYRAFSTSALREAKNAVMVLDRIKVRTGLTVEILSNSEQRFVSYKAVAAKDEKFTKIIEKSTAIIDVGAGSAQVSLFDNGALVTTQNIRLGAVRISEMISAFSRNVSNTMDILKEYVENDMVTLNQLFLKNKKIQNVIFVGDFIPVYLKLKDFFPDGEFATRKEFDIFYQWVLREKNDRLASRLDISEARARLILPSVLVFKRMLDYTQAEDIWMPGVSICDGVAVEYAQTKKKYKINHDFNGDILAAAKNISKRYSIRKDHIGLVEKNALMIYDAIKKYHGLTERDRFLLQIACILHDCGQYINLLNPEECSYSIIMSTEIIGLSHKERKIIASIVKYNTMEFDSDDAMWSFDKESYLVVAKLTAILRISNSLDRGHRQKFKNTKVSLDSGKMIITVDTFEDITLEKAYLAERGKFFEEMYGLKPVIRQRR